MYPILTMYPILSRRSNHDTFYQEEPDDMRILFKDTSRTTAQLCVAKIDSGEYDAASKKLLLYGSFRGRPALFIVPEKDTQDLESLFNKGTLDLVLFVHYYTQIKETANSYTIDFYR